MEIQSYLFFDGRCEEALGFYVEALGAEILSIVRMKDNPGAGSLPAGAGDKVLHSSFRIGATTLNASDGSSTGMEFSGAPQFRGFQLSLAFADEAQVRRAFTALSAGGQVRAPLAATFFSPCFGMVTDRFGVYWITLVQPAA